MPQGAKSSSAAGRLPPDLPLPALAVLPLALWPVRCLFLLRILDVCSCRPPPRRSTPSTPPMSSTSPVSSLSSVSSASSASPASSASFAPTLHTHVHTCPVPFPTSEAFAASFPIQPEPGPYAVIAFAVRLHVHIGCCCCLTWAPLAQRPRPNSHRHRFFRHRPQQLRKACHHRHQEPQSLHPSSIRVSLVPAWSGVSALSSAVHWVSFPLRSPCLWRRPFSILLPPQSSPPVAAPVLFFISAMYGPGFPLCVFPFAFQLRIVSVYSHSRFALK